MIDLDCVQIQIELLMRETCVVLLMRCEVLRIAHGNVFF